MNTISIPRLGVNASDENTGILPRYNLRTHRVPDLSAPLSEDNVRRFTREFYCRVILPLAAKTGMAWGRTETWLRKTAEKFKQITKRTFDAYIAELLSCGWIEYQIDDRGNLAINPLYCPPAATDRRAAGYAPPDSWVRESSAAKVFSARISAESSTKTPGFCSPSSYSIREDIEKENILTKTETVTVPAPVVGSLASQREKENDSPSKETNVVPKQNTVQASSAVPCTEKPNAPPPATVPAPVPGKSAASVRAVPSRGMAANETIHGNLLQNATLDLPAQGQKCLPDAAVQLVAEGKVTEGFAASVLAKAEPDVLRLAIAATREKEGKGDLKTWEGFLRRAVLLKWKPNGQNGQKASDETPRRRSDVWRAPTVTVDSPRPDKSTMYHQFTEAELNGEDVPVNAAQRPVQCPVETVEAPVSRFAGMSPKQIREAMQNERKGVK